MLWLMADANIQFWPKRLGAEKRTRLGKEGWLTEWGHWKRAGEEQTRPQRGRSYSRDIRRMHPRLSKVPAKGLGCKGHTVRVREENTVSELEARDRCPLDITPALLRVQTDWAERAGSRVDSRAWPAG